MSYYWTETCGTCGEQFVNSSTCTALECPDCRDQRHGDERKQTLEEQERLLEDLEEL